MSIDLDGVSCAEEAARLLPWYVVGRLAPADVERVERHLERCAICRADVGHEREVRSLLKSDARIEYAPQAGLAKTLARIDELGRDGPAAAPPAPPAAVSGRRRHAVQWLTAAVVVQAIGLGVLGGAFATRTTPGAARADYMTLSAPAAVAGVSHLRAVFAPGVTLGEFKDLLAARQLTVVGGPSDAGVYTLAGATNGAAATLEATVAALRSDQRVLFVERAVNDEPRPR